jgi:hypothetical protein
VALDVFWYWAGLVRIDVLNRSGQVLQELTVTIGSVTRTVREVPDAGSRSMYASVPGKGGVRAHGRLADGTPIDGEGGYIVGAVDFVSAPILRAGSRDNVAVIVSSRGEVRIEQQ